MPRASLSQSDFIPGGALRNPREIIAAMDEFRSRTLELVGDLTDAQMIGPRLPTVNPPLWEIGHVAWTQEFWTLRHLYRQKPLLENGDRLYNSTDVAHDTRWELLLPSRDDTLRYMHEVLSRAIERLHGRRELSPDERYSYILVTFHEGMHAEALAYTRQTLAYAAPAFGSRPPPAPAGGLGGGPCPGDVELPGGTFLIGATPDFPFVFDNEKWAHPREIKPFKIARGPVTNGEYAEFVEAGGYLKSEYWTEEGWGWLQTGGAPALERSFAKFFNKALNEDADRPLFKEGLSHPVYWRREANGRWLQRVFDRYVPLNENLPVVHVNWYEAQAYCNWAGRRLPTEAEWEMAASATPAANGDELARRYFPWGNEPPTPQRANLDWRASGIAEVGAFPAGDSGYGCRQMLGNVWEWTADDFQPYPGFTVDPYKEYSKPWFGSHKVLRGGCWATSSLLIRNTWRNFYTPDRRDVWAGFRTCAR
jgi:iron(II)-dependent oxidoreductase